MFRIWRRVHSRYPIYLFVVFTLYIISLFYETLLEVELQPNHDLPEQLRQQSFDLHPIDDEDGSKRPVKDVYKVKPNSIKQLSGVDKADNNMKYVLMWYPGVNPFNLLQHGQTSFIESSCEYINCYVTADRKYFEDISKFDVILFSSFRMERFPNLPTSRSPKQKYIFASIEPAPLYPANHPAYDNYFNLTWTYKLNSDIYWRYLRVYDKNGTVIGPAKNVTWLDKYDPIDEHLKNKLKRKTKAAAWLVSHCKTIGRREEFVRNLDKELKKYGWAVDTFGTCSTNYCERSKSCYKMLEQTFFFYLSFENSIEEDYVTEKLVTPLQNYVVPIVYGGADYSKFLPPGSYLNALELEPEILAKQMNEIIRNFSAYQEFFRWTNHYKYEHSEQVEVCNLCTALNNEKLMKKETVHENFRTWWNGAFRQKTYDFLLSLFLMDKTLLRVATEYNYTPEASKVLFDLIKKHTNVSSREKFLQETALRNLNETFFNEAYFFN